MHNLTIDFKKDRATAAMACERHRVVVEGNYIGIIEDHMPETEFPVFKFTSVARLKGGRVRFGNGYSIDAEQLTRVRGVSFEHMKQVMTSLLVTVSSVSRKKPKFDKAKPADLDRLLDCPSAARVTDDRSK